jgi:hypothetical protein
MLVHVITIKERFMQRYYDTLLDEQRGPFNVIVDKTWEDIHPRDLFDDTQFDIAEMCYNIDRGNLDWFMLRVRVFYEGVELATDYVGGFLYEDAREVLMDGTAEDMIEWALITARKEALIMKQKFLELECS